MRRFLLKPDLLPELPTPPTIIRVGYDDEGMEIRIREYLPGMRSAALIIGGDVEIPARPETADFLLQRCTLKMTKRRVKFTIGGVVWEIEYYDREISSQLFADELTGCIGTVDMPDGAAPPPWCGQEITGWPGYTDYLICKHGMSAP